MPEPQGDAPVVSNHGNTSFTKAGVNAGVSPTKLDGGPISQNESSVKSARQSFSNLNKNSRR